MFIMECIVFWFCSYVFCFTLCGDNRALCNPTIPNSDARHLLSDTYIGRVWYRLAISQASPISIRPPPIFGRPEPLGLT